MTRNASKVPWVFRKDGFQMGIHQRLLGRGGIISAKPRSEGTIWTKGITGQGWRETEQLRHVKALQVAMCTISLNHMKMLIFYWFYR